VWSVYVVNAHRASHRALSLLGGDKSCIMKKTRRTTPRKSGCEQYFLWLNSLNHYFTQEILIYLWGI
jgi:hypothetical protein